MIVLINGGSALDRFGRSGLVGRLVSPRSGNQPRPGEVWGADNDAFLAWDEGRYRRMLNRLEAWDRAQCCFVVAPDVVADARATRDRYEDWWYEIAGRGLPVALVGQDGAEDLEWPWDALDCWFVGGTTAWKLSAASADLCAEARRRGKWVHMGRVNTRRRLRIAADFAVDSVDGTGWSRFPDKYLRRDLPYLRGLLDQGRFSWPT